MSQHNIPHPFQIHRRVVQFPIGDQLPRRGNWFTQIMAQGILSIFGWQLKGEFPNQSKMVLIGAPHTSAWDMVLGMVVIWALGLDIQWMGKKSIFRWPWGGFMRWLGGMPVNREKSEGLVTHVVAEFQKRDMFLLVIMPAGTRAKNKKWKTGFYHIANNATVPICPIKFDFGRKVMTFGPLLQITGDMEVDMESFHNHFVGTQGKNWSES